MSKQEIVQEIIFDAAIIKAFEGRWRIAPSMEHYIGGGNVNGEFRFAILELMRWAEKKVLEAADEAVKAKEERIKELEGIAIDYRTKLNLIRSLVTTHEWPSLGHLAAAVLGEIEGNKNETT